MLDLAIHILKSKKAHFDPDKFEDRYEDALIELIKAKQAGKPLPKAPEAKPSNVINLMDALKRSVKAEEGGAKTHAHSAPHAATRAARRASAPRGHRTRVETRGLSMATLRTYRDKRDFGKTAGAARRGRAQEGLRATSSRSTPRRGCTTICASSSTA